MRHIGQVYVNGKPMPPDCGIAIHDNTMTKSREVNIVIPYLDRYLEFITELNQAPTLDAVVRNWSKHDRQDCNNQRD